MANGFLAKDYRLLPTLVSFHTEDTCLQERYDRAVTLLRGNEIKLNDRRLLKEGATYPNVWLETQPMAGEMYAKRDLEVGLNNVLIFLQYQRRDGRFPGMIGIEKRPYNGVVGYYDWLQGYYFIQPALKLYYLIGKDRAYLEMLYAAAKAFDDYLWRYRDSDGDGCLELFCPWDTGEDNCTRILQGGAYDGCFGGETAPVGIGTLPHESMELMAYSYANRDTLAQISRLLGNGEEAYWQAQAECVRRKVKAYLWDDARGACFDRDGNNRPIPCLSHVNLRCMYHGLFDRDMAESFLSRHLFNEKEFWTPMPLPAIAVCDPYFRNSKTNDWSGPCQGLIYQRAIEALHRYGHYAEALVIGRRLIAAIKEHGVFVQQWDPFTGQPCKAPDGYGPTLLSFTEYLSFLCGIHVAYDFVHWSGVTDLSDTTYTQEILGHTYRLCRAHGIMTASVDGNPVFSASDGLRIVTDLTGHVCHVIAIEENVSKGWLTIDGQTYREALCANTVYEIQNGALVAVRHIPNLLANP